MYFFNFLELIIKSKHKLTGNNNFDILINKLTFSNLNGSVIA